MKRLLVLALFVGCKSKPESAPPPVTTMPASAAVAIADAAPPLKPGQRVKASPAEVATRTDYGAALSRGRKLTIEKKYGDAIAAFDDALKYKPYDARAYAERGYAELLDGKLDRADEDLDNASEHVVADDDLLGQIYFNQGLVAEKQSEPDTARSYFARAAHIRPSAAVEAKLAGKSRCTAVIKKAKLPKKGISGSWASSWLDVATFVGDSASTEADAKKSLCPTCTGAGPWEISRPLMYSDVNHYWVVPRATRMVVGTASSGGCRCQSGVPCLNASGEVKSDFLVVTQDIQALDAFQVTTEDGFTYFDCKEGVKTHTETFFDLASNTAIEVSTDKQTISLDGKTVVVSGDGCAERITAP